MKLTVVLVEVNVPALDQSPVSDSVTTLALAMVPFAEIVTPPVTLTRFAAVPYPERFKLA